MNLTGQIVQAFDIHLYKDPVDHVTEDHVYVIDDVGTFNTCIGIVLIPILQDSIEITPLYGLHH